MKTLMSFILVMFAAGCAFDQQREEDIDMQMQEEEMLRTGSSDENGPSADYGF